MSLSFFVRCFTLLSLFILSTSVTFAQLDSTITVTYKGITKTFNVNDTRERLEITDLTPEEIEATLNYEPFWYTMFPPPKPGKAVSGGATPLHSPMLSSGTCPDLHEIEYDFTTGEVLNGINWSAQRACVPYVDDNDYFYSGISLFNPPAPQDPQYNYLPYTAEGWNEYSCPLPDPNDTGVIQSVNPFTIVQSISGIYDQEVLINGEPEAIELLSPNSNTTRFLRIGDKLGGLHAHRIIGTFQYSAATAFVKYHYAVAMHDVVTGHSNSNELEVTGRPYFTIRFRDGNGNYIDPACTSYNVVGAAPNNPAIQTDGVAVLPYGQGMFIDWQENVVDLTGYFAEGDDVQVEISMVECNAGGHSGWAYIDMFCDSNPMSVVPTENCYEYTCYAPSPGNYNVFSYVWQFSDDNGVIGTTSAMNPVYTFPGPGTYTIQLNAQYVNDTDGTNSYTCEIGPSVEVVVEECVECVECESSFSPIPGKKYVLSAWVKQSNSLGALTYEDANITLNFPGSGGVTLPAFKPSGEIIDGWQRIEQEFAIPSGAEKIQIALNNTSSTGVDVFFDDIRFHPFDASMKSFVYDPVTLRLSAELDERNYATYYEYDEEGALIRIKKETSRGVMTIQEGRNAIQKVN